MKRDQHVERISEGKRDERFRRTQKLRSSRDFLRIRQCGRQVRGIHLVVSYARTSSETYGPLENSAANGHSEPGTQQGNGSGPTRIGFSVSKRVGDAVTRNRVKRRLREAVRRRLTLLAGGWDLVVTARPTAATVQYRELAAELDNLFGRAGLWIA